MFLVHGTPTYQTSHTHKRWSTKKKLVIIECGLKIQEPHSPSGQKKGLLHFIITKRKKNKIYTSAKIDLNVWRHNRQNRCQSWKVLPRKHRGAQKNREKPVRNTAKGGQNVLLACPCLPPSFKSTHLLSGVVEGSCLAQSHKQLCNNNSHPRSKCVLGRRHFNSKANWTKVRHSPCPSSTWQWLLRKLILKVPQYLRRMKKALLTNHNRVKNYNEGDPRRN